MTQYLPAFNACQSMTFSGLAVPYNVHTLPIPGATSYVPLEYQEWSDSYTWSASYEVTYGASDADSNGFVSDFYAPNSTSTGGLNASSSIVQAVGYGGTGSSSKTGCLVPSPGGIALNGIVGTPNSNSKVNTADVGEGITYYASVLYAAQAALTAEATAHPGSKSAIVLLSDGQANTQWFYFPQGSMWQWPNTNTAAPSTKVSGYSEYDTLKSTPNMNALVASSLSTPNQEATGTISGVYPDFFDECQQAIVAGQYATSHGTRVYTVAYGSEDTGCGSGIRPDYYTDVTLVTLPSTPNVSFTLATRHALPVRDHGKRRLVPAVFLLRLPAERKRSRRLLCRQFALGHVPDWYIPIHCVHFLQSATDTEQRDLAGISHTWRELVPAVSRACAAGLPTGCSGGLRTGVPKERSLFLGVADPCRPGRRLKMARPYQPSKRR
jgi:hypothetical protein